MTYCIKDAGRSVIVAIRLLNISSKHQNGCKGKVQRPALVAFCG